MHAMISLLVLLGELGTFTIDPVALIEGREVTGKVELAAEHAGFRYLFADRGNLETFQADPERYAVQLGGSCGRMGPLSGPGSTDRYLVHEGKLFIFGSDNCRETFQRDPRAVGFGDEPAPKPSPEEARLGLAWMYRALAAHGGHEAIDELVGIHREREIIVDRGGKPSHQRFTETHVFPDKYRVTSQYDDWTSVMVDDGSTGWFGGTEGRREMIPLQRKALVERFARDPLMILRARKRPDFRTAAIGEGKAGPVAVDLLRVSYAGMVSVLALNKESGRIASIRFRGRGPGAIYGEVERFFSDYRTYEDVLVPQTVSGTWNGEPMPSWSRTWTVTVNKLTDPDTFARP